MIDLDLFAWCCAKWMGVLNLRSHKTRYRLKAARSTQQFDWHLSQQATTVDLNHPWFDKWKTAVRHLGWTHDRHASAVLNFGFRPLQQRPLVRIAIPQAQRPYRRFSAHALDWATLCKKQNWHACMPNQHCKKQNQFVLFLASHRWSQHLSLYMYIYIYYVIKQQKET